MLAKRERRAPAQLSVVHLLYHKTTAFSIHPSFSANSESSSRGSVISWFAEHFMKAYTRNA